MLPIPNMISIVFVLLSLLAVKTVVGVDYDGWLNIKMLHNVNCDDQDFCKRGSISVKSIKMGTSVIDQIPFNEDHIRHLKDMAESNGFYKVKTIVASADNREVEFLSSMKAEAYINSGLSDVINVWVIHTGSVVSVSFQVANSSNTVVKLQQEQILDTKLYLRNIDQAPVPDTASYVQKLEREREAREKGDGKDNRSFLAKYWMYIVPIAIFVMISGASNPEGAQGN